MQKSLIQYDTTTLKMNKLQSFLQIDTIKSPTLFQVYQLDHTGT